MLAFKIKLVLSTIAFILLVDLYSWQAVRTLLKGRMFKTKKVIQYINFGITLAVLSLFLSINLFVSLAKDVVLRYYLLATIFVIYLPKLIVCIFLLIDDLIRFVKWVIHFFQKKPERDIHAEHDPLTEPSHKISRSKFLATTGAVAGAIPFVMLSKGIMKGAYDYQVHRIPLYLKNLPLAFEGLKVVQLSDIHTGSLFDKDSVYKGIQMVLAEKPDVVFFTGDFVNNETTEAYFLMDQFADVKAPMGVFSIFGNHDYGDYISWDNPQEKAENLEALVRVHKHMGWNLMRNEHVMLEKGGQRIALIGVENWGDRGRFQKFGDIDKAINGMPDAPVQLLLSHDPSHFDSVVSTQYPNIQATFSGHTHGFQFGVENTFFKWSPSQYIYLHWAGLYRQGDQQLYVNRGYGFLGYPGRVGILPEITVFELKRA